MPGTDEPRPVHSREEQLRRIYSRARVLRLRRRLSLAALVAGGLSLVVVAAVIAMPRNNVGRVVLSEPETSSLTESILSTPSEATEPVVSITPTSPAGENPPCRNSREPRCGPFYWDPPPDANQPLVVDITYKPESPKVGEEVTFYIVATDLDAEVSACSSYTLDGSTGSGCQIVSEPCLPRYGPWTPVKRPGRYETELRYTYQEPGTYTASYSTISNDGGGCDDPYASRGEARIKIVVTAN